MIYFYIALGIFFIGLPILRTLINLYPEFLWFLDLGYPAVFVKILSYKFILFGVFSSVAFLFILINLLIAFHNRKQLSLEAQVVDDDPWAMWQAGVSRAVSQIQLFRWMPFLIAAVLGLIFSTVWYANWEKVLLFFNGSLLGEVDPVFKIDIGFFMFQYPFLRLLQGWLSSLLVLVMIGVMLIYLGPNGVKFKGFNIELNPRIKWHISILLAGFFLLLAWLYKLDMYQLLYSPTGIVFGAGYTDIHADLVGYQALFYGALIVVGLIFISIFRKGILLPLEGIGVLLVVYILLKGFYPQVMQQLFVKPTEIEKERPYIMHHIDYTRKAYNLNQIHEQRLTIDNSITLNDFKEDDTTIKNIRLWDHRPLLTTLAQLQEIRLYYDFIDVDIDRYWLNGQYQQVMLSARELDPAQLPARARNWINQRLTYTHGHGVVMVPVNQITEEGLPEFLMYDIPPKTTTDLELNNPSIYFGEATNKYVITNTTTKEFDYPAGSKNKEAVYNADSGIQLSSFWRKILFAIKFNEMKLLLSSYIKPESKVLYDRNIRVRVKKLAPFLAFDQDPYITVIKGKLYWIMDGYTLSQMYPYAEPFYDRFNYIRNPVKVVIDAYSGDTKFYLIDSNEPVIQAYKKIFPSLFRPASELDPEFRAHFRYPQDLFNIQAKLFAVYHMTDPQVYYNQEDLWVIPNETYEDNVQPMEPYYINMKLPSDDKLTFRLMLPFTPAKKNNLVGWMSANCDQDKFGEITVFTLPKEQLIYGPMQIESRIDQDTEISKQLTLWGQKGSRVIRGNLLVIPVKNSFLYVEPIYLQATQSKFPELKRVVVAYENKLAMESNLELALQKVFETKEEIFTTKPLPRLKAADKGNREVYIKRASRLYRQAEQAMRELNWEAYGRIIKDLGETLEILEEGQE